MDSPQFELRHRVAHSSEAVWRAWTDPAELCRWDPDQVDGELVDGAELVMHWESFGVALPVQVMELEEGRCLRLRALRPDGSSQDLRVSIEADGEGCEIALQVYGAMSDEEREGTRAGWYCQLRVFERFLGVAAERERRSFSALGPALAQLDHIYSFFREPTWLSSEGLWLEEEGQRGTVTTLEGTTFDLEVIAMAEGHEIACWSNALGGVIRLRALPLAGGIARLVGAQVIRWGHEPEAPVIEEALRLGVDRLIATIGGPIGRA